MRLLPFGNLASYFKWYLGDSRETQELRKKRKQIEFEIAYSQRRLKTIRQQLAGTLSNEIRHAKRYHYYLNVRGNARSTGGQILNSNQSNRKHLSYRPSKRRSGVRLAVQDFIEHGGPALLAAA